MAYRLEHGESVRDGVSRVMTEQLDRAVTELGDTDAAERDQAVAVARRRVKKVRAALRLVRGQMAKKDFRRQNTRLRKVAAGLAGARDASARLAVLDRLEEHSDGAVPTAAFVAARTRLREDRAADEVDLDALVEQLRAAREDAAGLELGSGGWRALGEGVRRTYRRGAAVADGDIEELHAWRKQVKDTWYHLRLLRRAWPGGLKGPVEGAHRLSRLLGEDHDLLGLRTTVDDEALAALVDARRAEVQEQARRLGALLYAEDPGAYTDRLHVYWRTWRRSPGPDAGSDGQAGAVAGAGGATAAAAVTVRATRGGRRYHREGCPIAGPNTSPLSFDDALSAGLRPCAVCRPDPPAG